MSLSSVVVDEDDIVELLREREGLRSVRDAAAHFLDATTDAAKALVAGRPRMHDVAVARERLERALKCVEQLGAPPPSEVRAAAPSAGWHTIVGRGGKAHYVLETGKTACADRKGVYPGATLGDLFTRPWRETRDDDHVCAYCARLHPRVCSCWSCTTKRRGGLR